jgi:ArsR family transcriptional regulator, arsenate/arsenite/antimonite-responsive transcriptional repressor / arsenate reductase (thioredoxin)
LTIAGSSVKLEAMNVERTSTVHRRAALHAALADPARLAIVDTLSLGDASPSELGTALGMPSNLLAHHLKVLEAQALVRRSRSEGDRRRSYLHLVHGALAELGPAPVHRVARVLFVCTANSARSQLATSLWRRASAVPVTSAGTHPSEQIAAGAVDAAKRHGLPLRRLRPRSLDDVLRDGDFVITVCDSAHEELGRLPDLHWSVPDPVAAGDPAAFDATLDELTRRVADLAPRLAS